MSVNTMEQFQATRGYNINGGGTPQLDLDTINNNLSQAQTDISNLQNDMTDAQSDIGSLQSDVTKLKGVLFSDSAEIGSLVSPWPQDNTKHYISLRKIINHLVTEYNLDSTKPLLFTLEATYINSPAICGSFILRQFIQNKDDSQYLHILNGLGYYAKASSISVEYGTPNNTGGEYFLFSGENYTDLSISFTGYKTIS